MIQCLQHSVVCCIRSKYLVAETCETKKVVLRCHPRHPVVVAYVSACRLHTVATLSNI